MVSQGSPSNSASSILHHFLVSDSMSNHTQFQNPHFDPYQSSLRANNTFHHPSLGTFIQHSASVSEQAQMSHTRHLMDLLRATSHNDQPNHHQNQQRLSLSLGSQMLDPFSPNRSFNHPDLINQNYALSGQEEDYSFMGSFASSGSYGNEQSIATFIGSSQFLKPTQSLLEEIVNGGVKENVESSYEKFIGRFSHGSRNALEIASELKELCNSSVLSADKHELQIKLTKLVSLLEEIEGRYEKYYQQMEEVASTFEVIAGLGSSKTYTALALQAMSRHFCNLRDAILSQVNLARRKICQESPKLSTGLSNLSLLDQENRHNRMSLQQLGLIQNQRQAWRPIRGLPETSVSLLRSWLFEHFLHPYPNDSEKLILASQTGLSKNQVSNWFINARVRLWKPMIEEMYKEEFADSSVDAMEGAATDHSDD